MASIVLTVALCMITTGFCFGADCAADQFSCGNGSSCLDVNLFCDLHYDCEDRSDEVLADEADSRSCRKRIWLRDFHGVITRFCALPDRLLLLRDDICLGENECGDHDFTCNNGECIAIEQFCDRDRDCSDGSDENYRYNTIKYDDNVTFCRVRIPETRQGGMLRYVNAGTASICVKPPVEIPDNYCAEQTCKQAEFSCNDGSMCLEDTFKFCNDIPDCKDGSDEIHEPSQAAFEGRMCAHLKQSTKAQCLLPKSEICDGEIFCDGAIDECLCDEKSLLDNACFKCMANHAIVLPTSKLCDNKKDCPDFTDECLCSSRIRPEVCLKLTWAGKQANTTRQQPLLTCASMNDTRVTLTLPASMVCDGRYDCADGRDEVGCPKSDSGSNQPRNKCEVRMGTDWISRMAAVMVEYTPCDGRPECERFFEEECNCETNATFCEILNPPTSIHAQPSCLMHNSNSSSAEDIYRHQMCDGVRHCSNYGDERGCGSRFYCFEEPLPNIPIEQRCDRYENCPKGEDEKNCDKQYACDDDGTLKYIPSHAVCDGIQDCEAGSDECQPGCINSAFSDEVSMVVNKGVLALVWIISVTAIIGCTAVIALTGLDLLKEQKPKQRKNAQREINKKMIMSLSLSDFLVGIFTFAICIKAAQFDHDYCLEDRRWRSSSTCAGLGALLTIGSEQSVFTMVLIALQRLHTVLRPFAQPKVRLLTVAIMISWVFSILLGIIPLISINEDYFVSSITFNGNSLFKTIYQNETTYMIHWLGQTQRNATSLRDTDWSRLKALVAEMNANITVKFEFGYYSSHTVCLPTFFPDPSTDKAWTYSIMLLAINSLAFIFMLIAYIALYRHATEKKVLQSNSLSQKRRDKQNIVMQRKLTRILATDFLCWMPICIMGFLRVGGVEIPADAYLPAGLLIIPINSALNPLLYSDLPDIMMDKLKQTRSLFCHAQPNQHREQESMNMTERETI